MLRWPAKRIPALGLLLFHRQLLKRMYDFLLRLKLWWGSFGSTSIMGDAGMLQSITSPLLREVVHVGRTGLHAEVLLATSAYTFWGRVGRRDLQHTSVLGLCGCCWSLRAWLPAHSRHAHTRAEQVASSLANQAARAVVFFITKTCCMSPFSHVILYVFEVVPLRPACSKHSVCNIRCAAHGFKILCRAPPYWLEALWH